MSVLRAKTFLKPIIFHAPTRPPTYPSKTYTLFQDWSMAFRAASILPRALTFHRSSPRSSAVRPFSTLPNPPMRYPTIDICPSPACACTPTPTGLEIDHKLPLAGTKPGYAQHIVICTGRDDWPSRIEDEEGPNLAKELKALLGPKGRFHDVCILCFSLPASASPVANTLF